MSADIKARQSQLVSTYGIGGLFPSENSSFMIDGLHEWKEERAAHVDEPRLARSLGVLELKAPPAGTKRDVPVIRFPVTQICPSCRRIGTNTELGGEWNASNCKKCKTDGVLSPFRLITACRRGHIDEFPFFRWLHKDQGVTPGDEHKMSMVSLGRTSSLEDLVLRCSCGVREKSLGGASSSHALRGVMTCKGRRPWLGDEYSEQCSEVPQVLQRGASNVWFPTVRSAISIPPYSEALAKFVNKFWGLLKSGATDEQLDSLVKQSHGKFSEDQIKAEIERRRSEEDGDIVDESELRRQEFGALMTGREEAAGESDFVCEKTAVHGDFGADVPEIFDDLRKVTRLREVRALYGFTRLDATADSDNLCALAPEKTYWLPAIEVIGEGVFLGFDRQALGEWAAKPFARGRAQMLQLSADRQADAFKRDRTTVDIVKVALHTFAHVLIDQFSLDAGYPASSLRERLFVDDDMAGVLIYTASSDSAGSLGGVASQADPERFATAVREGLQRLSWCSSDPVCIESEASGTDALNLAACHSCVLAPETSCELNNTYLDRALLFGTHEPDGQGEGVFSDFLSGL